MGIIINDMYKYIYIFILMIIIMLIIIIYNDDWYDHGLYMMTIITI